METFNTFEIRNKINIAHKDFIAKVGKVPEKITADHQLNLKRMSTRLNAVLQCFILTHIIDRVDSESFGGGTFFVLIKNGYDQSVKVATEGTVITVANHHYSTSGEDVFSETIRDIDFESQEQWEDIAEKILNYIHKFIFAREESIELKFFDRE